MLDYGEQRILESWDIVQFLEKEFPDKPSLFKTKCASGVYTLTMADNALLSVNVTSLSLKAMVSRPAVWCVQVSLGSSSSPSGELEFACLAAPVQNVEGIPHCNVPHVCELQKFVIQRPVHTL